MISADTLLTTHQVGELLQVDPSSVNNWVKTGDLGSFKTPGGHNRIEVTELVRFLDDHRMAVPRPLRGAARPRVLIADDDARERRSWLRRLAPHSDALDLQVAESGIDALIQVGMQVPRLIVLDIVMPGLDGIEVCRRLKAMPETCDVSVVLVTASLTGASVTAAREAGASAVWAKPIDVSALLEMLGIRPRPQHT